MKANLRAVTAMAAAVVGMAYLVAQAADVYVSQAGTGSDCTLVSPCSFATGMSQVVPGETVGVLGTITSDITISKSGTEALPITFEGGVYDGAGRTGGDVIFITGSNIVLKNAEVKNAFNFGIRTKGDNITISNVNVHHAIRKYFNGTTCVPGSGGWGAGIRIGPGSTNITIEDSESSDNCGEAFGILATKEKVTIKNSIGRNSWSVIFYVDQAKNIILHDNVAVCDNPGFFKGGAPSRGILLGAEGYGSGDVSNVSVMRNTIVGCKGFSFYDQVGAKLTDSEIAFNDLTLVFGAPFAFPSGTLGQNVNIHDNITAVGVTLSKTPTVTFSRTPTRTVTALIPPTVTRTPTSTPVAVPTICETAVSEHFWFMGCSK